MRDWLNQELNSLASLADSWIIHHAEQFSPFLWNNIKERFMRRKAFDESAVYLYVADGCNHPPPDPCLQESVLQHVNDRRYAELIARNPRRLLLYSFPVVYAKSKGNLGKTTALAVESVLRNKTVWALERLPNRCLDLWHFCRVYGFKAEKLDVEKIISLSCLNNELDLVDCTLEEAYALTHNMLFFYNFGVHHPDFPDEKLPFDLTDIISALILRFLAEDNLDIVLELVMVGCLHRQLYFPILNLVLKRASAELKQNGYIKAPKSQLAQDIPIQDCKFKEWVQNYHTMLVAASTFRILKRDWFLTASQSDMQLLSSFDDSDAMLLGQALMILNNYELPLAASILLSLSDKQIVQQQTAIFASIIKYILEQRDEDGNYGLFVDEKAMYQFRAQNDKTFEDAVSKPVNKVCRKVVDAYQQILHA